MLHFHLMGSIAPHEVAPLNGLDATRIAHAHRPLRGAGMGTGIKARRTGMGVAIGIHHSFVRPHGRLVAATCGLYRLAGAHDLHSEMD